MDQSMREKQAALQKPLDAKTIDFRVQSINKGGYAIILAYKDARVDINRLNEVFGVGGWQRKHERIDAKEFCSVGVWNSDLEQWVWVQDCGTESNTEAAKGQSSDAFKRACFNLGIGTELYDYPVISINLNQNEYKVDGKYVKATWDLKLRDWLWHTEFDGHKLTFIAAKDNHGKIRFTWGQMKPKPDAAPEPVQSPKPQPKPQPAPQATVELNDTQALPDDLFQPRKHQWAVDAKKHGKGGMDKLLLHVNKWSKGQYGLTNEQDNEIRSIIMDLAKAEKEPEVYPEGCDEYGSLETLG